MKNKRIKIDELKNFKIIKAISKLAPPWNKNIAFLFIGIFIGVAGITIINPGRIVQKTLNLVGINADTEQEISTEQGTQINQAKTKTSASADTPSPSSDDSEKNDNKKTNGSSQQATSEPEPTGSRTIITPEDLQKLRDSGAPYLIQGTDWKVKVNSQQPVGCGTQENPCPVGTTATVNVSAYNVNTGGLLPITECNGVWNKPFYGGDSTPTSLPDPNHCVLSFTASSPGMYRLQIELYLSKSVYTDTIYWGGWVWGTDSGTSGGYFVR